MMRLLLVIVAGCAGGTAGKRAAIPQAATAALQEAAGEAEIFDVARDGDLYEARWVVEGREHEAAVTAAGELVELEEEVASTQVPPAVRAAAIITLAGAQSIKFARSRMTGNYEAEAMIDGREVEARFSADGKLLAGAHFQDAR